jgi:hypothetical protein
MNVNWLAIPTVLLALLLFYLGCFLFSRLRSRLVRSLFIVTALVLGLPALLMAACYLHFLDRAAWFYEWRSLPMSELSASLAGLFAGAVCAMIRRGTPLSRYIIILPVLILGIAGPHLKPVIAPLSADQFQDRWSNGVCLQSTSSSCGAASAATVFRHYGLNLTESEIARECFTYAGGTENWYLARAFRKRGFHVRYVCSRQPLDRIPLPCIAGVQLGCVGHFIAVLSETETTYVIGDPMTGRRECPKDQVLDHYGFTGFFMVIRQ